MSEHKMQQIKTLIFLIKEGTVLKASAALKQSPSVTINQIQSLENSLNVKLFAKDSEYTIPTERGKKAIRNVIAYL